MVKLFLLIVLFSCFFLLSYLLLEPIIITPTRRLMERVHGHLPKEEVSNPYRVPLYIRLAQPLFHLLTDRIEQVTPLRYKKFLESKVDMLEIRYSVQQILLFKLLAFCFACAWLMIYTWSFSAPSFLFFVLLPPLLFFFPDLALEQQIKNRREDILSELPFLMDTLSVVLEAGTGFDNALYKICERKKGPLYTEFLKYLRELRMGSSRQEALQNLAKRINLIEMDSLVRSLIQGEKMGVSIAITIRLQAEQLRTKRIQRLREKAMKIPIKSLFPLVFFIFPPVFLVILGPAAIRIFQQLL